MASDQARLGEASGGNGKVFRCGRNERSSPGPEFHDHKLTGLPGTVATVAYAKNGATNPRQIVPRSDSL